MSDYEVIPHKVLRDLKEEVEGLREKLSQPQTPSAKIVDAMDELKESIGSMQQIFSTAIEYMKSDEEGYAVGKALQNVIDKLQKIETQNRQIAQGIVTIADMLEEKPARRPVQQRQPQHPGPVPPRPMPNFPNDSQGPRPNMPPPPPSFAQKKNEGIFDKIFK